MRAASQRRFRLLAVGLGALVAIVLAQAFAVGVNLDHLQATDQADDEAREEVLQYAVMVEAADQQQASLLAWRLGGGPKALAAYSAARAQFVSNIPVLRHVIADDPAAMRARSEDAIAQADAWTREVAEPLIAAGLSGRAMDDDLGQARLEALRADFAYLRKHELDLLQTRDHIWGEAFRNSRLALLVGSALAVVLAGAVGWRSFRRLLEHEAAARATSDRIARALERANAADRAKTTFLANMSHEMLTPLNGVAGMAAALGAMPLNERQKGMVSVIRNSAADLEGLIGNLLTLSRKAGGEGQNVTDWAFLLGDEVRAVAEDYGLAARNKGLRFAVDIPPEAEIKVRGDAGRLERVLHCLLSNAVKFTDRGEVRLGVARLAGDTYRFEISDTGVGFDEAQKERLFATFTQSDDSATRRFGGAGVGLAVAAKIASELGGRLDVHSKPESGSRFTFEVELAPVQDAPIAPPVPVSRASEVRAPSWLGPALGLSPRL